MKAATIYARITVDLCRSEFSAQHKASEKWDTQLGKMTGSSAKARMVNIHLDDVRTKDLRDILSSAEGKKPISA